jgi:hypothetical protein
MWEGVPADAGLLGHAQPGKTRHYLGRDERGLPQIRWLPAVWPPGEGPEA